jgi:3-hydroxy acid dehydrogenase/malonic semialdehyde reductase
MSDFFSYTTKNLSNKKILITGASSGIGEATSYLLSNHEVELYLVARRIDKLEEIKSNILKQHTNRKVHLLKADLEDTHCYEQMQKHGFFDIDVLINNAGMALGRDLFVDSDVNDVQRVIRLNIESAFEMARRALPSILNKKGDLINICSIAGHESYAYGAVYCATKAALLSFTKSLQKEHYQQNVRIMALSPGLVETSFSEVRFKGDSQKANDVYKGIEALNPMDMAAMLEFMLTRPEHVRVNEIITMPVNQASAEKVHKSN